MTTSGLVFVCLLLGGVGEFSACLRCAETRDLWVFIFHKVAPTSRNKTTEQRTYDCLLLSLPPLQEMGVGMVVSHHVDAKNQNLIFCKDTVLLPSWLVWFVCWLVGCFDRVS